ncbi:MAG: hypothetical protein ACXIUV_12495 [Alkalilacustris sp.]
MGRLKALTLGAAFVALSAGAAAAATVDIDIRNIGVGTGAIGPGLTAQELFLGGWRTVAHENFQDFRACPSTDPDNPCASSAGGPLQTAVGSFTHTGNQRGTGGSQVAPNAAVVRTNEPNPFGRFAVSGDNWLDTNDFEGLRWLVPSQAGFEFQKLSFFITDINDAGNRNFGITVGGIAADVTESITGAQATSGLWLVNMTFSEVVGGDTDVVIDFSTPNLGRNNGDGVGLDHIKAAVIPLPAPALLLLTGMGIFGGVGALRRRQQKAAA